ncbi:MAG TPA: hypothetical protein VMM93_08820 [Vicinamibacterales bacterium]|nr:hypothetical protein [Vicinamibacterales bacterium]
MPSTRRTRTGLVVVVVAALGLGAAAQQPPPPVPRPFPGAAPRTPAVPPAEQPPAETTLAGAPVYPTAEFLESFDAGQNQRYYLYGSNTSYETIVTYYRSVLRNNGREIFREPAMHQFELGRFDDNRMAFPPSVVVKDYAGGGPAGYLFVDGTTEKRFLTIIQIVPAAGDRLDPVSR